MTIFLATIIFVYHFAKLFLCLSVIGSLLAWPRSGVKMSAGEPDAVFLRASGDCCRRPKGNKRP